jgi:hypothetical protein
VIRLSVTDLETFRYWQERDDGTLEDLIAQLTGAVEPTPQMRAARAFHKAFEDLGRDVESLDRLTVDGYTFDFEMDGALAMPPIRELKAEGLWQTPSGPVTLVGKVDGLAGLTVHDYKLSERFEAERYLDSWQWRAYLTMFHARRFVYEVFQCYYDRADPTRVHIVDLHPLAFDRYPQMEQDLSQAVCALAEVVVRHCPQKVAA